MLAPDRPIRAGDATLVARCRIRATHEPLVTLRQASRASPSRFRTAADRLSPRGSNGMPPSAHRAFCRPSASATSSPRSTTWACAKPEKAIRKRGRRCAEEDAGDHHAEHLASVKPDKPRRPGGRSCRNSTSCSGPTRARHAACDAPACSGCPGRAPDGDAGSPRGQRWRAGLAPPSGSARSRRPRRRPADRAGAGPRGAFFWPGQARISLDPEPVAGDNLPWRR